MTIRSGTVYLVGAGPGDPGLITVRGLEALRRADVVIHDRLIPLPLLDEARPDAEIIDAGKARARHTLTQDQIDALLVDRARAGHAVVRLKGGDPFVFGRGWEELLACRVAGIPCEVIPGVTSAIAGPAAAEIPVTARGVARSFTVVTAQTGDAAPSLAHLDFTALASLDTVIFLMGVGALPEIVAGLLDAGRDPDTPVAIVERATLPGQRELRAKLATVIAAARDATIASPSVIIVGAVAALTASGASELPLAGRRILVTRPRTASHELSQRLRALGAGVIDCPLISIRHVDPPEPPTAARLATYDWIVFTSRHAARSFHRVLRGARLDARAFSGARIAAVGPTTARELEACALTPDLIPDTFRASHLADAILSASRDPERPPRILFPHGTLARDELVTRLTDAGVVVDTLIVYETLLEPPDARAQAAIARGLDAVLLASPSAAEALAAGDTPLDPATLTICIGPTTGDAARRTGMANILTATDHSDAGLIHTLLVALTPVESPA